MFEARAQNFEQKRQSLIDNSTANLERQKQEKSLMSKSTGGMAS